MIVLDTGMVVIVDGDGGCYAGGNVDSDIGIKVLILKVLKR